MEIKDPINIVTHSSKIQLVTYHDHVFTAGLFYFIPHVLNRSKRIVFAFRIVHQYNSVCKLG